MQISQLANTLSEFLNDLVPFKSVLYRIEKEIVTERYRNSMKIYFFVQVVLYVGFSAIKLNHAVNQYKKSIV